jgi:excisionase family DNA binding protein
LSSSTEEPRFLRLTDVSAILNISTSQIYALVRSGELKAIQIGGRNQWRVERRILEEYIAEAYRRTAQNLGQLPAQPPPDETDVRSSWFAKVAAVPTSRSQKPPLAGCRRTTSASTRCPSTVPKTVRPTATRGRVRPTQPHRGVWPRIVRAQIQGDESMVDVGEPVRRIAVIPAGTLVPPRRLDPARVPAR